MINMKDKKSKSCWNDMEELGYAIQNGLEVPNCIPDSAYSLNEAQIFVSSRNRELQSKYKKTKEWLDNTIASGDKDYAEKLLIVIDRWKMNYEEKIRTAKSYVKESKVIDANKLHEILQILDVPTYLMENQQKVKKSVKRIDERVDYEIKKFKKRLKNI